MTEPENPHSPKPPHASYQHRDYSFVWLVPLLALVVVGWMAWSSWHDSGPVIHITFEKSDGVDANRTQIRHKGVVLGVVTGMAPTADFSHVTVTARMDSIAAPYLNKGAKFWIVRPRISVGAVSDLNTLVSGVFIELIPGEGDHAKDFTGLEEPVTVDPQQAGKSFVLHTPQLGSLERGSPIYFHGVNVGEVTNFELTSDTSVALHIFIRAPYDKLVYDQTRFWNVSGIGITAGPTGIKVAAQSLQSIAQGGIAFDVPDAITGGAMAADNATFPLYPDRDNAFDSVFTQQIFYQLHFNGPVEGLDAGAAVNLLGSRVGHVVETRIDVDEKTGNATPRVIIDIQPERMHFEDTDAAAGMTDQRGRDALREMVKHKLRAQIASGNLLTGQKNINLSFVEDAPPAAIADGDPYPEFPTTAPDDLNTLLRDAHNVLTDSDKVVRGLGPQLQSITTSFKNTTDQINSDDGNGGGGGLSGTLYELKQAAQSVRALADYLDAHPEAILHGKEAK